VSAMRCSRLRVQR